MTTKQATNHNKVPDLRQDISNLKNDVSELAQHAVAAGSANAQRLREQAGERFEDLKDASYKNMARVEKRIREKPGQSLAIAFGAGVLLSLLLGRK